MSDEATRRTSHDRVEQAGRYRPPAIVVLGTLGELTRKTVGGADGSTFLGLDIGSV